MGEKVKKEGERAEGESKREEEFSASYNAEFLNPPVMVHNLTKAVHEQPHYRLNFAQFRYWWDWGTCPLYKKSVMVCTGLCRQTFRTMHVCLDNHKVYNSGSLE